MKLFRLLERQRAHHLFRSSHLRDCAIITWKGGGGWETRGGGGIGENHNQREGGLDVNFNTYKGGGGELVFTLFFTNQKSGRRAIRVEIFIPAYVWN